MKMTPLGKGIIVAAIVGAGLFGAYRMGYLNTPAPQLASVPPKIDIPGQNGNISQAALPTGYSQVALTPSNNSYTPKVMTLAWNATMGLQYANGDVITAPDSLMAKRGIHVALVREDDYSKQQAELTLFAAEVAKGVAYPTQGAAFTIIMGDGYPAYVQGLQEQFVKLNQQVQVVGAIGYSRGEDKCMLPPKVKANAQLAKGSLIGAVLRDGDWNICVKWASDNGIRINPDEKTYDPDAMNFVAVDSFQQADEKLIAGYCEDRLNVTTNRKQNVCQNGTATWTPGDVTVAKKKGGVVPVASTKEYMWQMPAVVIGNKQWMENNRAWVENFLAAALEGGEQVRSSEAALLKGAAVSAKVYKEENAEYWARYYKGVTETDATGQLVSLGGSTANGVADNAYLFGLNGNDNLYKRVYNVYGGIAKAYYPKLLPALVPYDQVVNTSYVQGVILKTSAMPAASVPTYRADVNTSNVIAKRSYSIEFDTGKASFTGNAMNQLDQVLNGAAVTGLYVQVNGHTDNIGNPDSNIDLSKKRADAVKRWLVQNSSTMNEQRVRTRAYGDTQPVDDNHTPSGRSHNRRVEIILSATE
jgi:OOP family OmpA-OmpF porin